MKKFVWGLMLMLLLVSAEWCVGEEAGDLRKRPVRVALTFDDGSKDHIEIAAPMLEERGWRGTFNLITDRIGDKGHLSWDDVKELICRGHEVVTHTKTHPNLVKLLKERGTDAVRREWAESRDAIVRNTGFAPRYACMPFGQENETIRTICREEGLEPFGRCRHNFGTGDEEKVGPWLEKCFSNGVVRVDAMCHGVTAGEGGGWHPFADRVAFAKYLDQIAALEKAGKVIVTDYAGMESDCALKAKVWPRHGIVSLSFDDRHMSSWRKAFPLFERYKAKATFFITGVISTNEIKFARRALAAGHEVGLHGRNHWNADKKLSEMGAAAYWTQEVEPQLSAFCAAGIPIRSYGYPNNRRDDRTDAFFMTNGFTRLRGNMSGVRSPNPHGSRRGDGKWMPITICDAMFVPAATFLNRQLVSCVCIGEKYGTDIDDVLSAVARAGERGELLALVSHGIKPGARGINAKTEWIEKILSSAAGAGVIVRGVR